MQHVYDVFVLDLLTAMYFEDVKMSIVVNIYEDKSTIITKLVLQVHSTYLAFTGQMLERLSFQTTIQTEKMRFQTVRVTIHAHQRLSQIT